jgi:hypothetical protein
MEANGSKKCIDVGANMTEQQKACKHEFLEQCYGFARSSGWKGIGVGYWCMDCYHVPKFEDDTESMDEEEIEHNRIKREAILALEKVC